MDKEKVRKSIMPMLTATRGSLIRIGTTNRIKGDFYEKIKQNKTKDSKIGNKVKRYKKLHFEYEYKRVISDKKKQYKKDKKRFHLNYGLSVEDHRETMGENSDDFRMSYKLEWLLEEGMFITEKRLESIVYNKQCVIRPPSDIDSDEHIIAGLDVASAKNSTVLTIGSMEYPALEVGDKFPRTIVNWVELANLGYKDQFEIISEVVAAYKTKVLVFDYTGVGRALGDFLIYYLSDLMYVIPYTFTTISKSDMWTALDDTINNKLLTVPYHPNVKEIPEFKNFEKQMLSLSKRWIGKILMCQKIQGEKDDYCDSLALMNLAADYLYEIPQDIEVSENIFFGNNQARMREYSWVK